MAFVSFSHSGKVEHTANMANDTLLTDDYVAGLLAKEASDASIKYSSVGLEAFRSSKPANKAKPNTNFLGRIIKETANHNKALLAKEAAEAQARLNHHTEVEERKRQRLNPTKSDIRRRQLGAISSILQGRKEGESSHTKSNRDSTKERRSDRKGRHSASTKTEPFQSRESKHGDEKDRERSHRRVDDDTKRSHHQRHERSRSRSPGHRERRERRYRDRSPLSSEPEDNHRHHSRPHGRRSGKDGRDRGSHSHRRHEHDERNEKDQSRSSRHSRPHRHVDEEDSDPLDELIGPAPPSQTSEPPVRVRGRGAGAPRRGAAAMDSRFAKDYDPKNDVPLDDILKQDTSSSNTWDSAVELFRDRQKWKQQGADRLRAAGFTEEQIKKWERGGKESEKDMFDSVKYTKKGEQREWDRGKSHSNSDMDLE
ncbi:uncharacterized protein QC761_120450 [Podospora bellae-mahoneyi]|uniref:Pre-mRNA-splicing factor 38B n=1 Tax=Podospora bellae-mahoneyi TaxID=2093777 RepID=A0ABR0G1Q0_9PEZI|nr:hypothetical protein QC761_120450 [Podospora bellae-mahoneyi]